MGNFKGKLNKVSSNPADFEDTQIWIISGPANIHQELLTKIKPFVKPNSYVGTLFAQGGFKWICNYVFGGE
jgi:hypothetical protein